MPSRVDMMVVMMMCLLQRFPLHERVCAPWLPLHQINISNIFLFADHEVESAG